ncbi:MAG TPA: glycoside hydrolase family 3 N-terminal domain-containing protein, partial [Elusimicrobiales bacterium]|nr:glycoside hydrolase family 3 N-terminal domain-containing protein [Elusimicrobiales bacterium]
MKKILLFLAVINLNFLYSQNLEDKISQMLWPAFDTDQTEKIKKAANENIGGIQIMWGEYSDEKTRGIIQELYEITKDSYPPFIAIDYEGGSVYIHQTHNILNLPSNMAIGKSEDYKNIPILFYLLGLELKKLGINTVFSPTADVNTEKYNPIINVRAFSDDKNIVTKISEMVIDGFTSAGIIPTLKHFPGHGMTRSDSHLTLPVTDIDPIELYQTHIYPFKSIIEKKKADIIMVSHVLYKNIDKDMPASLSR